MNSTGTTPRVSPWLLDSGLKKLESLLRSIVYQSAEPILVADSDRNYRHAICGAARLFGLSRDRIIGRKIDDFAETGLIPQIDRLWRDFLQRDETNRARCGWCASTAACGSGVHGQGERAARASCARAARKIRQVRPGVGL